MPAPRSSLRGSLRQVFAVAAIAIACASCASNRNDAPNTLGVLPLPAPTPLWLGVVHPSASSAIGGPAVAGAAAVAPSQIPGWAHVLISLRDGAPGELYSWSLRSGSCVAQGDVIGTADRYGEFAIHADGSGAAEAMVAAALSSSASYSVVATPVSSGGPAAPGTTNATACANLTRGSM